MVTMYGSPICPDCVEAVELFRQHGFTGYDYKIITESTEHLKAFLHLRDTRVELGPARAAGKIGIPVLWGRTAPSHWMRPKFCRSGAIAVKISAKALNRRKFPVIMDKEDWYSG